MKIKNKFKIKKNEKLIFSSFNIRNFEVSKYWSFCIWLFEGLTPTPLLHTEIPKLAASLAFLEITLQLLGVNYRRHFSVRVH